MAACSASGFLYAGLTGRVGHYYCYCSCAPNPAAPPAPNNATYCPTKCSAGAPGSCGGDGAMAAYGPITCTPAKPPSHTCGPPAPPLPPGPACSQAASRAFGFCNTSLSLETRVADLVRRISVGEAGALLTARESPAIPRLGIPAFYWGTNALHGVVGHGVISADRQPCEHVEPVIVARRGARGARAARCTCRRAERGSRAGARDQRSARPTMGRNQERGRRTRLAGAYGAEWSLGMQYDRRGGNGGSPPLAQVVA